MASRNPLAIALDDATEWRPPTAEEEGVQDPGIVASMLNPFEWLGSAGGGAYAGARLGTGALKHALEWGAPLPIDPAFYKAMGSGVASLGRKIGIGETKKMGPRVSKEMGQIHSTGDVPLEGVSSAPDFTMPYGSTQMVPYTPHYMRSIMEPSAEIKAGTEIVRGMQKPWSSPLPKPVVERQRNSLETASTRARGELKESGWGLPEPPQKVEKAPTTPAKRSKPAPKEKVDKKKEAQLVVLRKILEGAK